MTKKLLILAASLFLFVLVISCSKESGSQTAQTSNTANVSGASSKDTGPIIQFTAYDTDGKEHSSSEWLGKEPVVINFWGTWCPPCRREIPDLVKLYAEYHPKGVEILGLAVKDSPSGVKSFAEKEGMKWVMLMADVDIATQLKATEFVPTTIFFDKSGHEVGRAVGQQSYSQFKTMFDKIL
jgi:thiol-disulfide isomerase/thioredoxin